MGMNFYVKIKYGYNPENEDIISGCSCENGVRELTNGFVWNNTYYKDLDDLQESYVLTLHLGKSSLGWHFGLCIYPSLNINNLDDWVRIWKSYGTIIVDEEGRVIDPDQMYLRITKRGRPGWTEETREALEADTVRMHNELFPDHPLKSYDDLLIENSGKRGLNGLMAHNFGSYKKFPATGGTYDLTDEPDFS